MSLRSNVRPLILFVLTLIYVSKAAYTIESIGSATELNVLTSINSPTLAAGSNFFVNSQLDASNNLLLGYYNLSVSPTTNTGNTNPSLAIASAARVAASGDYVGVAYADTNNAIYFVLLKRTGSADTAFTTITTKSVTGSGSLPWVGSHPYGWIVAYKTGGGGVALASFDTTTGNALQTASVETGGSDLISLGTSTGTSFVLSYNKAVSLSNSLYIRVCTMASDGTFTVPAALGLAVGSTLNTVPSRSSIAPNGVALVSYVKANGNFVYVLVTSGSAGSESPALQSSAPTNMHAISLGSNLFVLLWEASNAINALIVPADASATTSFPVIGSGATYPAAAALGQYHFVLGWASTATKAKSTTQHWAIQYCGDGFVTSNEQCDSGPYCQSDCTCPSGQGPLGTGCTAPGVPFTPIPPPSPPTGTPTITPPSSQTPTAGAPTTVTPTSGPASAPVDSTQPNANPSNGTIAPTDAGQTPSSTDPLDQLIGLLPARYFIVVIVVPVVAVAVAVVLLVVLLQRRKRRKDAKKSGPFQGGDDGSAPTQYDQIYVNSYTMDSEPMDLSRFTVDERLHIKYSELLFRKEIGSGAFGKVFIGEWQKTKVALKLNMMAQGTEFEKEARLMVTMRPHPNVVQLYGISTDGPNPVMIIEFCEGGSLDTKLYKARVNLSLKSQLQLISGIAKGLLHLHRNKIVHRDLAARNILLAHGKPMISDFGMSRQLEGLSKAGQTKTTVGPVRWMAPESLSDLSYSPQSDVWSFGCVIYEIIAQQEPHANTDILTIGIKIRDNGYTPPLPKRVDPFIKKLLKTIWQKDPAKRPTMEQLATTIDEHLAKLEEKESGDSSTTPSPVEASALDKSIHEEPHNNVGQSSEYDNIKENVLTGKSSKKGKSPRKEFHAGKKRPKHQQAVSQEKMIQSDNVYDEINVPNQLKMEPMAEVESGRESSSSSSSSSLEKSQPLQGPKVPPRSKPSTPQRSLPPVPPRSSQNYPKNNIDDGIYDVIPK